MKKCVKHFAQILCSILSAVSATVAFYLISGLALRNSTQDTWLTVLDIITAILALIFNLLLGLRFCGKLNQAAERLKKGKKKHSRRNSIIYLNHHK